MISNNLLHVSARGCHPQGVFQIKVIQTKHANLGRHRPHWNDLNINILKYIKLIDMKLEYCDIKTMCQQFVAIDIPYGECMKNLSRSL